MEAKCLAIAHAELGGIAVHRAAHRRPHLLENRTMTSNMMSTPADRAHLACQEESGACATVLCDMQHGKDVVAVKRVRIGGRWGARGIVFSPTIIALFPPQKDMLGHAWTCLDMPGYARTCQELVHVLG